MTARVIAQLQNKEKRDQFGIHYRIDLGVGSLVDEISLQPLKEVQQVSTDNLIRYHAGDFEHYIEAMLYKKYAEDLGFEEASIAAYYNAEQIPVEDAIEYQSSQEFSGEEADDANGVNELYWRSLRYEVQIGAFSEEQDIDRFMALGHVKTRVNDGIIYYTFGEFESYKDAKEGKQAVINAGFDDVFLIALLEGEKVLIEEAVIFEAFREQMRHQEEEEALP